MGVKTDLTYVRPTGQEVKGYVIEAGKEMSAEQQAVLTNWFAFSLMAKIVEANGYVFGAYEIIDFSYKSARDRPPLKMGSETYYNGTFPDNARKIAFSISSQGIAIATRALGIEAKDLTPNNNDPSVVTFNLNKRVTPPFVLPPAVNPSMVQQDLYRMYLQQESTNLTLNASGEEIRCHSLLFKARAKEGYENRKQHQDKFRFEYSPAAVKALVEYIYTDSVAKLPENLEDGLALVELGHEFKLPNLKILGSVILSHQVSLETFLKIDACMRERELKDLSKFLQTKMALDSTFKTGVDLRLRGILASKLAEFVEQKKQIADLEASMKKIQVVATAYDLAGTLSALKDAQNTMAQSTTARRLAADQHLF